MGTVVEFTEWKIIKRAQVQRPISNITLKHRFPYDQVGLDDRLGISVYSQKTSPAINQVINLFGLFLFTFCAINSLINN